MMGIENEPRMTESGLEPLIAVHCQRVVRMGGISEMRFCRHEAPVMSAGRTNVFRTRTHKGVTDEDHDRSVVGPLYEVANGDQAAVPQT
jgi:hypothetical protein